MDKLRKRLTQGLAVATANDANPNPLDLQVLVTQIDFNRREVVILGQ